MWLLLGKRLTSKQLPILPKITVWLLCCCSSSLGPRLLLEARHLVRSLLIRQANRLPLWYHLRNKGHLNTELNTLCVSRHDAPDLRGRCVYYTTDKCGPEIHPAISEVKLLLPAESSRCTDLETCYLHKDIALIFRTKGKSSTWEIQVRLVCNGNTKQRSETWWGTESTFDQ